MLNKYKGIIVSSKVYKENDLLIKFLSDTDELISGIVYGGMSKKKKNIFQSGFFLDLEVNYRNNRPPTISGELKEPYISSIINDKYKISCLLSIITVLNLSIIEGQKNDKLYEISAEFIKTMILKKRWLMFYFKYNFNFLKIIGYDIDYSRDYKYEYFDLETLDFTKNKSISSIYFPYSLFESNNVNNFKLSTIQNFFKIFETILLRNHLSNINLQLPNQYVLFKKLILDFYLSR